LHKRCRCLSYQKVWRSLTSGMKWKCLGYFMRHQAMKSQRDIEAYLQAIGRPFESLEGGTFLVNMGKERPSVALRVDAPLVVARISIGQTKDSLELYRTLLEYNARVLIHTCFGLEDNRIVLSAALELENLDLNELEAVLSEIDLTLTQEVPKLHKMSLA
jgi:hypothetical protein